MNTYTVTTRHDTIKGRGLSLETAARVVMEEDGHEWEIRREDDGGGFRVWTSLFSRNSTAWNGLTRSVIGSFAADENAARAEIFRAILINAEWFRGCQAMTDAEYDSMQ